MGARPERFMNAASGRRRGRRGMRRGGGPLTPEQRQARRERRIARFSQRADDFAARSERADARATKTEEDIKGPYGISGTSGRLGPFFGPIFGDDRVSLQRGRAERLRGRADKMRARAERIRSRIGTPPPTAGETPVAQQVSAPIGYASNGRPVVRSDADLEALPTNFSSYPAGGSGIENVYNAASGQRIRRRGNDMIDARRGGRNGGRRGGRSGGRRRMMRRGGRGRRFR